MERDELAIPLGALFNAADIYANQWRFLTTRVGLSH
jgi:hypothetical protein